MVDGNPTENLTVASFYAGGNSLSVFEKQDNIDRRSVGLAEELTGVAPVTRRYGSGRVSGFGSTIWKI